MRLVIDSMLGSLARWLRILGYDTIYYRNVEDWLLINIAKKEDRVLITRDLSLYRRALSKGVKSVYIDAFDDVADALAILSIRLGIDLTFKESKTRCPKCNTELMLVPKAEVLHLIPKNVALNHDKFWRCPKCNKVYWQGAHWKTIDDVLKRANNKRISGTEVPSNA